MFLGQTGMFLSFQARRSSATRSSTSDLTVVSVPSFSEIGWGSSGRQRVCGRESMSQRSIPCKLYDEIVLGLLMLA